MPTSPRARRAATAVLLVAACVGSHAQGQADRSGGALRAANETNNGVRAHCNGGGSCCKNHGDSEPCPPADTGYCTSFPTAPECWPA